jgi:hypothetical protein
MMYRKDDKVLWRDGDDKRTERPGVLVRKTQDGNRVNVWIIKLEDQRVVHAYEREFRAA